MKRKLLNPKHRDEEEKDLLRHFSIDKARIFLLIDKTEVLKFLPQFHHDLNLVS